LGALAENPVLLEPARSFFRSWYAQARTRAGLDGVLCLLVLDGLFIHQVFGMEPVLDQAELAQALARLAEAN
jgi:hypothetical protein